jgi:hypothetical protein
MKPTVPEVLPIVRELYARHSAGCCWHVVLDNGNVHRDFVLSTAHDILVGGNWPCRSDACRRLAELLPEMSTTQIRKLSRARKTVAA